MKRLLIALVLIVALPAFAREYHVSVDGDDSNKGSKRKMLRTISAAARLAQPGDEITVHAGTYREQVNPPRGGTSARKRITYQAAKGERVVIKGSELIKGWKNVSGDGWVVTLNNSSMFGSFNPYDDYIWGDWGPQLKEGGGTTMNNQHSGMVFINGTAMIEAASKSEFDENPKMKYWFGKVSEKTTTLWGRFIGINPNTETIEINVRQSCFFPTEREINYITIRGFEMSQAATPWAPPTALQIGIITVHWCKGWIVENNTVKNSRCVGITLSKHGDQWDNAMSAARFKHGSTGGAGSYNSTIDRAISNGWSKARIGSHVIRNNDISYCGQAGMVGSMGCAFSTITGNTIHHNVIQQRFGGAETGGIKFHGAVDTVISGNHIYDNQQWAIWLDWMAQGTHVKDNFMHDNSCDFFAEANHGPFSVYNNLFLSKRYRAFKDWSHGGAYFHNIFIGPAYTEPIKRHTPYFDAHATTGKVVHEQIQGNNRWYNNIFVGTDLTGLDPETPQYLGGNVFIGDGAKPSSLETDPLVASSFNPAISVVEDNDDWYLDITLDASWTESRTRSLITTSFLGENKTPNLPFDNPDGSPIRIDTDYFGNKRNARNPFPGPLEQSGKLHIKVWPRP